VCACVRCSVPRARVQRLEPVLSVRRRRGGCTGPGVRRGPATVPWRRGRRRLVPLSDRSWRRYEDDSTQTVRYAPSSLKPSLKLFARVQHSYGLNGSNGPHFAMFNAVVLWARLYASVLTLPINVPKRECLTADQRSNQEFLIVGTGLSSSTFYNRNFLFLDSIYMCTHHT